MRDTDRTVVDFGNGINSAFTLNTSPEIVGGQEYGVGRVLTVTIGATFTATTPGSVGGLQIPADIVDSNSNTDVGGNEIVLTNADVTIDNQ